jgi:hypothetical protein
MSERRNAFGMFEVVAEAGLVYGVVGFDDEQPDFEDAEAVEFWAARREEAHAAATDGEVVRASAIQVNQSEWSGGLVTSYELDVTTWASPDHDVLAGHFDDRDAAGSDILALLAGQGWSLSIARGEPDGVVPADLVARLLALFPDGVVVFAREFPEAHWYEPRFASTDQLVAAVAELGLIVDEIPGSDESSGREVNVHTVDAGASVTFVIVDGFAETAVDELRRRFRIRPGDILVGGDGWAAWIDAADSEPRREHAGWMSAIAGAVATACDARMLERVTVEGSRVERWESGATRFGPQSREVTLLLVELAAHTGAWAYEPWSTELELAARGVEVLAVREGRQDALDTVERELRTFVMRDFVKHTGRRALRGLVMRDLLRAEEYGTLTREWRGRKGRIHPEDADVQPPTRSEPVVSAGSEEVEDADWSERAEAEDILHNLLVDELVDEVGRPLHADEDPRVQRRGALKRDRSNWSDDDVDAYEIEVTAWLGDDHDVEGAHLRPGERLDDPAIMFLLAGDGWSLTARHRDPDADIPIDLAQQLLAAIGDGEIVWHRGIPHASWFETQYSTATEMLGPLRARGFEIEVAEDWSGDPYLVESLADDTFAPVILRAPGARAAVRANLLIDDHFAPMAMQAGSSYFDATDGSRLVSGDGWVIEVVAHPDEAAVAMSYAEALGALLGGTCLGVGSREVRVVDDLATRWGPQTVDIRLLMVQVATWDESRMYDEWTDAHQAAWDRARTHLIGGGRFGWIREGFDHVDSVARFDFTERAGKNAFAGLLARDYIPTADYDLLTREWREVVGRIHPSDASVVARIDDDIRDAVAANPFLGRAWHPLVALLSEATDGLRSGFWRVGVVRPLGDRVGPFVQVARNPDDTLHVEVGGHVVVEGPDGRRRAELAVYGFSGPDSAPGKPLPFRTFAVEVSGREVAAVVLEVLAVVYDVDAGDVFTFAGSARGIAGDARFGLVRVGEESYRLG